MNLRIPLRAVLACVLAAAAAGCMGSEINPAAADEASFGRAARTAPADAQASGDSIGDDNGYTTIGSRQDSTMVGL